MRPTRTVHAGTLRTATAGDARTGQRCIRMQNGRRNSPSTIAAKPAASRTRAVDLYGSNRESGERIGTQMNRYVTVGTCGNRHYVIRRPSNHVGVVNVHFVNWKSNSWSACLATRSRKALSTLARRLSGALVGPSCVPSLGVLPRSCLELVWYSTFQLVDRLIQALPQLKDRLVRPDDYSAHIMPMIRIA